MTASYIPQTTDAQTVRIASQLNLASQFVRSITTKNAGFLTGVVLSLVNNEDNGHKDWFQKLPQDSKRRQVILAIVANEAAIKAAH